MKGSHKLGVAAVALAVGILSAGNSSATPDDRFTSYTQPANALVMPFDATEGRRSFFLVSNIAGVSPTGDPDRFIAGVTTHWSYWSENCGHLADVYVCLTLNDTIVVDPTDIRSIDAGNVEYGPEIDLSGQRGMVVVTAFATGEVCGEAAFEGFLPVDNALVGTYTLADIPSGAALGVDAIGLGLNTEANPNCPEDAHDRFIQRSDPDFDCHTQLPEVTPSFIDIQTFDPETLDLGAVILLSLREAGGSGPGGAIEVGPNSSNIRANSVFYDNLEVPVSLPDVVISCTDFRTMWSETEPNPLIPTTVTDLTAGLFRLRNFSPAIGGNTGRFIYAVYGQALGTFGSGTNGKYLASSVQ